MNGWINIGRWLTISYFATISLTTLCVSGWFIYLELKDGFVQTFFIFDEIIWYAVVTVMTITGMMFGVGVWSLYSWKGWARIYSMILNMLVLGVSALYFTVEEEGDAAWDVVYPILIVVAMSSLLWSFYPTVKQKFHLQSSRVPQT